VGWRQPFFNLLFTCAFSSVPLVYRCTPLTTASTLRMPGTCRSSRRSVLESMVLRGPHGQQAYVAARG
jgi:hypothetical protein